MKPITLETLFRVLLELRQMWLSIIPMRGSPSLHLHTSYPRFRLEPPPKAEGTYLGPRALLPRIYILHRVRWLSFSTINAASISFLEKSDSLIIYYYFLDL
jgi:hypothetical protein